MRRRRTEGPLYNENLTIRINTEMRDALEEAADKAGITVGSIVRKAIEHALVARDKEPTP